MSIKKRVLRIGVDGTCLRLRRGYSRFLGELLPALLDCDRHNKYVLFLDSHTAARCSGFGMETVVVATGSAQADAASARGSRTLGDMRKMGRAVSRAGLDLMYFPSVYSFFPVPGATPVAVTFHDTIAERYGETVFPNRRARWLWNLKVTLARRRSQGVLTVSEWSRRSLADWFSIPPERIYVTPEAPSGIFRPVERPETPEGVDWDVDAGPYLIYVGGFNPHKNLGMLVEAFAELVRRDPENGLRLAMVGDYETDHFFSEVGRLREQIRAGGVVDRVGFLGFVPDDGLRQLYAGATALVLPSLEEGFGLPAVEAAACGTPCVATRNSPLPELLEGGGLFLDPHRPQELIGSLERMVNEPELQEALAERARERAESLSWRAAAEATQSALEQIAGGNGETRTRP